MKDNIQLPKSCAFIVAYQPEMHQQRRQQILLKYPEVKRLFGYEPLTKYIVMLLLAGLASLAYAAQHFSWVWWWLAIYLLGATLSHSIYTGIHELTHHLGFKSKFNSRIFSIIANLFLAIPMAMGFEKYHFIHHRFLGDAEKDVDIPFFLEAKFFNSRGGKFIWLLIQPITYGIRPLIKLPQKITAWEWVNILLQLCFNIAVVWIFSWSFLAFLILSSLIAMSIHPTAAHAIAEHYTVNGQQETYSYYGPLNYLLFNVGHHVEHHDFPNIPWSRIHKLRKMAPEFYESLYIHKSWVKLMMRFIFTQDLNLFSRVIRP